MNLRPPFYFALLVGALAVFLLPWKTVVFLAGLVIGWTLVSWW